MSYVVMRTINESPDEIVNNEGWTLARWDEEGDVYAFNIINKNLAFLSEKAGKHSDIKSTLVWISKPYDIEKIQNGEQEEETNADTEGLRIKNLIYLEKEHFIRVIGMDASEFIHRYFDDVLKTLGPVNSKNINSGRNLGLPGRIWLNKKIISFWKPKSKVLPILNLVDSFLKNAKFGHIKNYKFNFVSERSSNTIDAIDDPTLYSYDELIGLNNEKPSDEYDRTKSAVSQISSLRGKYPGRHDEGKISLSKIVREILNNKK